MNARFARWWYVRPVSILVSISLLFLGLPVPSAAAASLGSSSAAIGAPLAPLASTIQTFQPDLFTGRATLAVPLEVAPGRRGVQPALGLSYVSGGRNGWVGTGWGLELGCIERSTRRGVPSYGSGDTFAASLQGVQAELVSIGSGEYRAKDEGAFLRFQFDGTTWTVWSKDGTRYRFGFTSSSRLTGPGGTFRWGLDQVLDPHGNTLTVTYTADGGMLYPSQLQYTGHVPTSQTGPHTVDFVLQTRPDVETSYRSGFAMTTAKRLSTVEVKASGALVRRYQLAYTASQRTGRSLLASVTQVGADGVTTLPPVTFSYQHQTPTTYLFCACAASGTQSLWMVRTASADRFSSNGPTLYPSGYFSNGAVVSWSDPVTAASGSGNGVSWSTAGNGSFQASGARDSHVHAWTYVYTSVAKTLSIAATGSDSQLSWFLNGAFVVHSANVSLNLVAGWNLIELTGYNQNASYSFNLNYALTSNVDLMHTTQFAAPKLAGDFDGNGVTDLALFDAPTGTWKVSTAQDCNVAPSAVWKTNFGYTDTVPLVGDQNGDGRADIWTFKSSNGLWAVQRSDGTSFNGSGASPVAFGSGETPLLGEFNGDGTLDLATFYGGSWRVSLAVPNTLAYADPASVWLTGWGSGGTAQAGDFNGDGLTDIAYVQSGSVSVALCSGQAFVPQPTPWITGFGSGQSLSTADLNGDGLSDLAYYNQSTGDVAVAYSTGAAFGAPATLDTNFTFSGADISFQVGDFTGDGLADPAVFNTISGAAQMARSDGETPDLVKSVANGVGGTTTIAYISSTAVNNLGGDALPDLPMVLPLVSQTTVADGMGHSYVAAYSYSGGRFDPVEKEFRGFATVAAQDALGAITETVFFQDTDRKGKPQRTTVKATSGSTFAVTENVWSCTAPYPDVHFCHLDQTDQFLYDGDSSFKQTRQRLLYDSYGNVTKQIDDGEVSVSGDGRVTITDYAYNTTAWLVGAPVRTRALNEAETTTLSEQRLYYDGATSYTTAPTVGLVTKQEAWLHAPPAADRWLATTMTYDAYGSVLSATDALSRTTTTAYDAALHTFPVSITNAAGHVQTAVTDARFGITTSATDANNITAQSEYDTFGRLVKAIGPLDTSALPTVTYSYDLGTVPAKVVVERRIQSGQVPTLRALQFVDGLGRVVQTRAPAEASGQQVVTGMVDYDARGQATKQYLPLAAASSESYIDERIANPTLPYVSYGYDAIGRATTSTDPNGAVTTTLYDDWRVTVTDASSHQMRRTSDVYGRLATVEEFNAGNTYTTTYAYDLLGRLTGVTDAAGNVTSVTYDSFGRKLGMTDPDMGAWSYGYNDVGNLTSQTDARGVVTTMTYDALNRLAQKSYTAPGGSGVASTPTVTYTYDDAAKPYRKGRLSGVADGSGSSSFEYDQLGRLIKETKTVSGTPYVIQRAYDLLGRLTTLTYPDNDAVTYTYNSQGGIETMVKNPGALTVVSNANYNASGQLTQLVLGNGVTTTNSYDPLTLRLSNLTTQSGGQSLQGLSYTYDPIGNITAIADAVTSGNSQTFQYDDLNRLTYAQGNYGTVSYSYNAIGNIITKEGRTYSYGITGGAKPHAVTAVTGGSSDPTAITYDANGNLLAKTAAQETLTLTYDAENRLVNAQRQSTAPQAVSVTLNPGWNWFALPVDPANDSITSVLSSISGSYSQVSRYNATTDSFEHYVGSGTFDQFTSFEPGRGYQVYCTAAAPASVIITGPPVAVAVPLATSSNLIGVASSTQATVSAFLAGLQLSTDYDTVWRYNGTGFTALAQSATVTPGESVYLHMLQPDSWTPPTPTATTAMLYDGDGGRVQTTVNGQTTTFLGQLVDVTGGVLTKHLYFGSQRVGSITSGATSYIHADHLGSTNRQSNSSGTATAEYTYTPFGSLVSANPTPTGSSQLYTGQRLDAGSGLYCYKARYYDPDLGRFVQPDTVVPQPGDPQALNRYSYVRNNPVAYVDPDGHGWFIAFLIAAAITAVTEVAIRTFHIEGAAATLLRVGAAALGAFTGGLHLGLKDLALRGSVIASAGTAATLQTGEGRQFLRSFTNRLVDLGVSRTAASILASTISGAALSTAYSAAFTKAFTPRTGLKKTEITDTALETDPKYREFLRSENQGESGGFWGKGSNVSTTADQPGARVFDLTDAGGNLIGVGATAPLFQGVPVLGSIAKALKINHSSFVGPSTTGGFTNSMADISKLSYATLAVCHQDTIIAAANAGVPVIDTALMIGPSSVVSTMLYGPYGQQGYFITRGAADDEG